MTDALPPFTIDVTPESVCRWLIGRDGRLPDSAPEPGQDVPMSYLFFLRGQPAAVGCVAGVPARCFSPGQPRDHADATFQLWLQMVARPTRCA